MKRALPIVVVVLVVLALVFPAVIAVVVLRTNDDSRDGGSDGPDDGPTVSAVPQAEAEGAREAPAPELQPFYDQKLDWSSCGSGNDCAKLEVPLDYADPAGEKIEIALLRNPADRPRQRAGHLVVNPGGPGAPGTSYAEGDDTFGESIHNRFDIIGFDPRGTGASAPVDCLDDRDLDAFVASDPDPDNAAEEREFVEWAERMGDGCKEKSGRLAEHVSTHEAARDMDVLRAALGDAKLTYLGASYGTKLGATYADLFPTRSGRLVLDGAVDPSLTSRESSLQQAHGFEVAITAYVDHCLESAPCYLGDTRAAALKRIKGFLDSVDAKPLAVDDRELAVGNAFLGIITPLYNSDYWEYLDTYLGRALKGDGSGLLLMADLYTSREDDGSYADNSAEAIYVINCLDDPSAIPVSQVPAEFPAFEKESPTFGRIFAWGLVGCTNLGGDGVAPDWKLDAPGADPILVIGTTRDPATPLRWAEALASQLSSGVLVTRDGDGHTGYNMGNLCVDEAVETYLIDGTAPKADLTC